MGIERAPQYSASKHGVLGLMRAIDSIVTPDNIRIAAIHPWFAGIYPLSFVPSPSALTEPCAITSPKTRVSSGSRRS